jgi:hypothetical protein
MTYRYDAHSKTHKPELSPQDQALLDVQTLADDVEKGYHLPKRFRAFGWKEQERLEYVAYLREEYEGLLVKFGRKPAPVLPEPVKGPKIDLASIRMNRLVPSTLVKTVH